MSPPARSWSSLARPHRSLLERSAPAALLALSLALLVVGKVDVRLASYASQRLGDLTVPALAALAGPVAAFRHGLDRLGGLLAAHEENRLLRDENRRLLGVQAEAARLAVENRALRRMLGVAAEPRPTPALTARIVGDTGGAFVRTLLLDAGTAQGVELGMAAVTPEGLVGRVIERGERSARVLLITDLNSRVPVVVGSSGDHALLEGDNSPVPALRFLPLDPAFAPGDRVLTSGRGGLLPAGLPVGLVEVADDGSLRVRPSVDWARLDYVALLPVAPTSAP